MTEQAFAVRKLSQSCVSARVARAFQLPYAKALRQDRSAAPPRRLFSNPSRTRSRRLTIGCCQPMLLPVSSTSARYPLCRKKDPMNGRLAVKGGSADAMCMRARSRAAGNAAASLGAIAGSKACSARSGLHAFGHDNSRAAAPKQRAPLLGSTLNGRLRMPPFRSPITQEERVPCAA